MGQKTDSLRSTLSSILRSFRSLIPCLFPLIPSTGVEWSHVSTLGTRKDLYLPGWVVRIQTGHERKEMRVYQSKTTPKTTEFWEIGGNGGRDRSSPETATSGPGDTTEGSGRRLYLFYFRGGCVENVTTTLEKDLHLDPFRWGRRILESFARVTRISEVRSFGLVRKDYTGDRRRSGSTIQRGIRKCK